jgi:hypothetical protein
MGFSFKAVENEDNYAPIPEGIYRVQFAELEEKPSQSGGVQWSAKMKMAESNRSFFINWNVEHENEMTQRIAREQISQVANLLGVELGGDITVKTFHTNQIFVITLKVTTKEDKTYYSTKGGWKLDGEELKSAVDKAAQAFGVSSASASTSSKPAGAAPWLNK